MPATKHQHKSSSVALAHLNELLDEALKETFPASDPVAIDIEIESPKQSDDAQTSPPAQRQRNASPTEMPKILYQADPRSVSRSTMVWVCKPFAI